MGTLVPSSQSFYKPETVPNMKWINHCKVCLGHPDQSTQHLWAEHLGGSELLAPPTAPINLTDNMNTASCSFKI